jgi:hypothetical protein
MFNGRVDVAVVFCPTVRAYPASYSKPVHTFRTAGGNNPAARTDLGAVPFIELLEPNPTPDGLVLELGLEHEPSGVEDGLRHPGLRQFAAAHIADDHAL